MKKLYVLQHERSETLGTWEEELQRWHVPFEYVEVGQGRILPAPETALAAIVMGGSMNVSDVDRHPFLSTELALLRSWIERETPVLGVCLGAQLLAAALGAPVAPGPRPEIGYQAVTLTPTGADDPLLSGFPMDLMVFQWHTQGFGLPAGAIRLATSADYENQAFRQGKVWGFQFHLEVTPKMVDEWASQSEQELSAAGTSRAKLSEQAVLHGQVVSLFGRQVIRRFWDAVAEV